MSSTFDRRSGSTELSPYALPRVYLGDLAKRVAPPRRFDAAAREAAILSDPNSNAPRDMQSENRLVRGVYFFVDDQIGRLAAAVAIVAGLGFVALSLSTPAVTNVTKTAADSMKGSETPAPARTAANAPRPQPAVAQLSVDPSSPAQPGQPIRLRVLVADSRDEGVIVVSGLAPGAALSAGKPVEEGWRLSLADLRDLTVLPAKDFVGAMDIAVELRLADASLGERRTQRLEWVDERPADAAANGGPMTRAATPEPSAAAPRPVVASRPVQELETGGEVAGAQAAPRSSGPDFAPQPAAPALPVAESRVGAASPSSLVPASQHAAASNQGQMSSCFAKIDGKVVINGRCRIDWTKQQSVTFEAGDKRLAITLDHGRVWLMKSGEREYGKVFRRGSCWGSERIYVCEHGK